MPLKSALVFTADTYVWQIYSDSINAGKFGELRKLKISVALFKVTELTETSLAHTEVKQEQNLA